MTTDTKRKQVRCPKSRGEWEVQPVTGDPTGLLFSLQHTPNHACFPRVCELSTGGLCWFPGAGFPRRKAAQVGGLEQQVLIVRGLWGECPRACSLWDSPFPPAALTSSVRRHVTQILTVTWYPWCSRGFLPVRTTAPLGQGPTVP